jgi:hypothetical protein
MFVDDTFKLGERPNFSSLFGARAQPGRRERVLS